MHTHQHGRVNLSTSFLAHQDAIGRLILGQVSIKPDFEFSEDIKRGVQKGAFESLGAAVETEEKSFLALVLVVVIERILERIVITWSRGRMGQCVTERVQGRRWQRMLGEAPRWSLQVVVGRHSFLINPERCASWLTEAGWPKGVPDTLYQCSTSRPQCLRNPRYRLCVSEMKECTHRPIKLSAHPDRRTSTPLRKSQLAFLANLSSGYRCRMQSGQGSILRWPRNADKATGQKSWRISKQKADRRATSPTTDSTASEATQQGRRPQYRSSIDQGLDFLSSHKLCKSFLSLQRTTSGVTKPI